MTLNSALGVIRGHWKWHHSIAYEFLNWGSIVTMTLSCIISEIGLKRDTGQKLRAIKLGLRVIQGP